MKHRSSRVSTACIGTHGRIIQTDLLAFNPFNLFSGFINNCIKPWKKLSYFFRKEKNLRCWTIFFANEKINMQLKQNPAQEKLRGVEYITWIREWLFHLLCSIFQVFPIEVIEFFWLKSEWKTWKIYPSWGQQTNWGQQTIWDYFRPGVSWEIIGFNWIYRKSFTHIADTNDPFNHGLKWMTFSIKFTFKSFLNNVIDFLRPIEFFPTVWRLLSFVTCWRTLRGQTAFWECKRIPQQAKSRFVAESQASIFFFDLLRCFGFHGQIS